MAAGLPVTQADINNTAGDISRSLEHVTNRVKEFKQFTDQYSADDLAAQFGFDVNDATVLKSAVGEMDVVAQAQTANRTFQAKIMGLGDV